MELTELLTDSGGQIWSWEGRGVSGDLTLALSSLPGLGVMFSFLFSKDSTARLINAIKSMTFN